MRNLFFLAIFLSFFLSNLFSQESKIFSKKDLRSSIETPKMKIKKTKSNKPSLKEKKDKGIKDEAIVAKTLKSIVLFDSPQKIIQDNFEKYQGIVFVDLAVPGKRDLLIKCLEKLAINKPLTRNKIIEIQNTIICYYKKHNHSLIIVYPPDQKISKGVLQFVVIESKLGEIRFLKNRWFSSKLLKRYIHLKENKSIDSLVLTKDLIAINKNPFRNTIAVLKPGIKDRTTDIEFITKDRIPYRLLLGYDNTGYKTTGEQRLFTGVDLANLFNQDQILSYQYIVSTEFGKFFAHTAKYLIPIPGLNHQLEFFGGYSGISALMPIEKTKSKGNSWQTSFRYTIPLVPRNTYTHECKIGFDYKKSNVNLIFDGIPIVGSQTVVSQIVLGYNSSFENSFANASFDFLWFISPGQIFPDQSKKDYRSLASNARSTYTYVRGDFTPIFHIRKNFELIFKTAFQLSSQSLLSSEQFGLGGYNTVRGYNERELNTDNGLLLSSEFRTPRLRPLSKFWNSKYSESLQFLGFLDYGFGVNHKSFAPIRKNFHYLLGTGIGMRYFYNSYVNARVDLGFPLHHKIADNIIRHKCKVNFSLIISF
jgi:hemolysin activation/secretion protein